MALKIRLRQQGRSNRQVYRLVVTDTRAPRDGAYLEMVGWYNPYETEDEKIVAVNADRISHWLNLGAQMTEKAEKLIERSAPAVVKGFQQKQLEKKANKVAKRKANKKAAA